ncbi:MAG: alkaline phosphatase family protein [Nannocystaceae bacterium]|nr:alkaline phosphatase family protein [Nannocystaceae bacterium]
MRRKDLEAVRRLVSRRRALQGMGAVLGASAIGCGDDAAGQGGTSEGSSSTGDGSSGGTTGTGTGTSSTTSGVDGSSSSGGGSSSDGSTSAADSSTGENPDACNGDGGLTPAELLANIDTIVVVVMENRSFDHYFGSSTFLENWQVEGLTGNESNPDADGNDVTVFAMANLEIADPPHDWDPVHASWNDGAMDGFVQQHQLQNPDTYTEVMGYYVRDQLPVLYALAEGYTLCDHWFCALLGPTWPNRFYVHGGSSGGGTTNFPQPLLTNVWDLLADAGISHANYYNDIPWVWGAYANPFVNYTAEMDEFFAAAEVGSLPRFSVIDPNFGLLGGGEGQNDDHPDANVTMGQVFLASVYQALAASPQWPRCLLVITYDEHGGFYDHVAPPIVDDDDPDFNHLGVRVPGLVIGPSVRRGCVNSNTFEHCSILATVNARFGLSPINDRVAQAPDLSSCIDPAFVDDPQPPIKLPMLQARLRDLLATNGPKHSHPEMRELIAQGKIPIPAHRRHADASRDISMTLISHAQRLGVLKLVD